MRLAAKLSIALIALGLVVPAVHAGAAARPTLDRLAHAKLGMSCSKVATSDHVHYVKCSGEIPSFDGIGIDTDLSLPVGATKPLPTVLMLHGWGNDKTDWEATSKAGGSPDRWHWNNVWFVSRGWVAVNTTARGFKQSCGQQDQDSNCPNGGYTHLSDRAFETRDSQTLLGKLVDAGIAAPKKLVSTGGSYGGGPSPAPLPPPPLEKPAGGKAPPPGARAA